jgi:hypothetical protein
MNAQPGYFQALASRFAASWNQFWFTPGDPLPLGVLRIGVGLLALYLTATYGFDLRAFFDPQTGLLPLDTVIQILSQTDRGAARFSYFDYATDGTTLQVLHYVGVAVVAAFVVGFQTRITSILTWIVFISYFHRGPHLTTIAEPVVAFLLLYLAIGPSGATLSVDDWLRRRREGDRYRPAPPSYLATVALRLIQVHTGLVYFLIFCGKLQNNDTWWNGTAVWWLIARPESCLVNLRFLADAPYLINLWTLLIVLFELAFALLIWNRTARPLLLGLSAVMMTGTAVLTGLIPFCLAMFLAGLAFVPADSWRTLAARRA